MTVDGSTDAEWTSLRAVLADTLRDGGGASFAVTLEGRVVANLWGGAATEDPPTPWSSTTLVNLFSTTKGLVAFCAHLLIERGLLDIDAPIAQYWPEFGQNGKEEIPVRFALDHRVGLPMAFMGFGREALDWTTACGYLAAAPLQYEPGTLATYHAMTFGHLVGEVVRRITGRSIGQFLRDEISGPLGADVYIGLPATEHERVAALIGDVPEEAVGDMAPLYDGMLRASRSRRWREAEMPSMNGHGTALAVATVYGCLANGGEWQGLRLVESATVEGMRERSPAIENSPLSEPDTGWCLGFMPNWGMFGPNPRAFGHTGFGGSFGMADPERRLSLAYATNRLGQPDNDPRAAALVAAVYDCLG